jgi:hypothetical protein
LIEVGGMQVAFVDVVLVVWFALVALSVAYVAYDAFTKNPEMTVMKWGWVLVTLYTGPVGLAFYVLSCKELAPGTHEEFVEDLGGRSAGIRGVAAEHHHSAQRDDDKCDAAQRPDPPCDHVASSFDSHRGAGASRFAQLVATLVSASGVALNGRLG